MNTLQLERLGKSLIGPSFIGVYAADQVPERWLTRGRHTYNFIVNNQTKNLPGQHWIGVSIKKGGDEAFIFDPLGFPPSKMLANLLNKIMGVRRISYNTKQIQNVSKKNCGQLVLLYLIFSSSKKRL